MVADILKNDSGYCCIYSEYVHLKDLYKKVRKLTGIPKFDTQDLPRLGRMWRHILCPSCHHGTLQLDPRRNYCHQLSGRRYPPKCLHVYNGKYHFHISPHIRILLKLTYYGPVVVEKILICAAVTMLVYIYSSMLNTKIQLSHLLSR